MSTTYHRFSCSNNLLERPKRALTAYNYFFHDARQHLLQTLPASDKKLKAGRHGKIGFAHLAKTISAQWKAIGVEQKIYYANLANEEKMRYRNEMAAYKEQQRSMVPKLPAAAARARAGARTNTMKSTMSTGNTSNMTRMDPLMAMTVHPVPYDSLSSTPSIADLAR